MNFWKYLVYRIAARESEKAIYNGIDAIKNLNLNVQFPTLFRSVGSGLLSSLGLFAWYIILTAFRVEYINWLIPIIIGFILALNLFFKKYTFALKEVPIKVSDKRYKKGFREEYKLENDYETLVELRFNHRVFNWIEAIILLTCIGLIIYAHFEIYPNLR